MNKTDSANRKPISVWTVARFEFMRYFKWKQELIGLAILIILFAAMTGGGALMSAAKNSERFDVAVIDPVKLDLPYGESKRLTLLKEEPGAQERLAADVDAGKLDGLLVIRDRDNATLIVNREPSWRKELNKALGDARLNLHLQERGISKEEFERWQKPVDITLEYSPNARRPASDSSRTLAMILVGVVMTGIMTGFALFFASITSEKQQRVSELVVSAIPHQTWIDGKLIGLTGHGLKGMVTLCLYGLVITIGIITFGDGDENPLAAISWTMVGITLLFALGGLLFWNGFLCAIAATIDDPNSSTRSSVMMVPMLFIMLVFFGIDAPENLMMRVLSWLPMSSIAAMPARVAHGTVAAWEIAGSLLLLIASIFWMRRIASRIFQAGMLFYGKEASWGQIWDWVRARG